MASSMRQLSSISFYCTPKCKYALIASILLLFALGLAAAATGNRNGPDIAIDIVKVVALRKNKKNTKLAGSSDNTYSDINVEIAQQDSFPSLNQPHMRPRRLSDIEKYDRKIRMQNELIVASNDGNIVVLRDLLGADDDSDDGESNQLGQTQVQEQEYKNQNSNKGKPRSKSLQSQCSGAASSSPNEININPCTASRISPRGGNTNNNKFGQFLDQHSKHLVTYRELINEPYFPYPMSMNGGGGKELQEWGKNPGWCLIGWTALHYAAHWGHLQIVKLLLHYGANPSVQNVDIATGGLDKYGNNKHGLPWQSTPLQIAAYQGKWDIVWVLLKAGAKASEVDSNKSTALHLCAIGMEQCQFENLGADGKSLSQRERLVWKEIEWQYWQVSKLLLNFIDTDSEGLNLMNVGGAEPQVAQCQNQIQSPSQLKLCEEQEKSSDVANQSQIEKEKTENQNNNCKTQTNNNTGKSTSNSSRICQRSRSKSNSTTNTPKMPPRPTRPQRWRSQSASNVSTCGSTSTSPRGTTSNSNNNNIPTHLQQRLTLYSNLKTNLNVDPDARDTHNQTPLLLACATGNEGVAKVLLELCRHGNPAQRPRGLLRSVNPNSHNQTDMKTPLIVASQAGFCGIVRLLLISGASPHVVDIFNRNPLHLACLEGKSEVCELLLNPQFRQYYVHKFYEESTDTESEEYQGQALGQAYQEWKPIQSPRASAFNKSRAKSQDDLNPRLRKLSVASRDNIIIADSFKSLVNQLDCHSWTPLHYAAWAGHFEIVELLLANGAQADATVPLKVLSETTQSVQLVGADGGGNGEREQTQQWWQQRASGQYEYGNTPNLFDENHNVGVGLKWLSQAQQARNSANANNRTRSTSSASATRESIQSNNSPGTPRSSPRTPRRVSLKSEQINPPNRQCRRSYYYKTVDGEILDMDGIIKHQSASNSNVSLNMNIKTRTLTAYQQKDKTGHLSEEQKNQNQYVKVKGKSKTYQYTPWRMAEANGFKAVAELLRQAEAEQKAEKRRVKRSASWGSRLTRGSRLFQSNSQSTSVRSSMNSGRSSAININQNSQSLSQCQSGRSSQISLTSMSGEQDMSNVQFESSNQIMSLPDLGGSFGGSLTESDLAQIQSGNFTARSRRDSNASVVSCASAQSEQSQTDTAEAEGEAFITSVLPPLVTVSKPRRQSLLRQRSRSRRNSSSASINTNQNANNGAPVSSASEANINKNTTESLTNAGTGAQQTGRSRQNANNNSSVARRFMHSLLIKEYESKCSQGELQLHRSGSAGSEKEKDKRFFHQSGHKKGKAKVNPAADVEVNQGKRKTQDDDEDEEKITLTLPESEQIQQQPEVPRLALSRMNAKQSSQSSWSTRQQRSKSSSGSLEDLAAVKGWNNLLSPRSSCSLTSNEGSLESPRQNVSSPRQSIAVENINNANSSQSAMSSQSTRQQRSKSSSGSLEDLAAVKGWNNLLSPRSSCSLASNESLESPRQNASSPRQSIAGGNINNANSNQSAMSSQPTRQQRSKSNSGSLEDLAAVKGWNNLLSPRSSCSLASNEGSLESPRQNVSSPRQSIAIENTKNTNSNQSTMISQSTRQQRSKSNSGSLEDLAALKGWNNVLSPRSSCSVTLTRNDSLQTHSPGRNYSQYSMGSPRQSIASDNTKTNNTSSNQSATSMNMKGKGVVVNGLGQGTGRTRRSSSVSSISSNTAVNDHI